MMTRVVANINNHRQYLIRMRHYKIICGIYNSNTHNMQLTNKKIQWTFEPLSAESWDVHVPYNFNSHSLVMFDDKSDPQEHIITVNTQMTIIWAINSLKCKLIAGRTKEATLIWYMSLPRLYITNYRDMMRKIIHQFSTSKHRKVFITSVFNILQGYFEFRVIMRILGMLQWWNHQVRSSQPRDVCRGFP